MVQLSSRQLVMSPLQIWYSLLWSFYCWDLGIPGSIRHNENENVGESNKCHLTLPQCEDRQKVKLAHLTAQGGNEYLATYIVCEISKTYVDCLEEYICTCSNDGASSIDLVNDFHSAWQDYLHHCTLVSGHALRVGSLQCEENIIQGGPAYTTKDMTTADGSVLLFNDSLACPGVLYCRNVSSSYRSRSSSEATKGDMKTVMCEGIRLSLVCMNDAFCYCGMTTDPEAKVQMSSLKYQYQQLCQQEEIIEEESQRFCPGEDNLCKDFLLACERRVLTHYKTLLNSTDYTFISCETFKVRIQCFEDFICTCPGKDTSNLEKGFHDYKKPYEEYCQHVPGHISRFGDLRCQGSQKLQNSVDRELGDIAVSKILVTPDIVMYQSSVRDVSQLLKGKCPTSSRCSRLRPPEYQPGDNQCRQLKHQVLCQAEVICRCTTDNQSFFWSALGGLLYLHNITCREEVFIEDSFCKGAKQSSTVCLILASICLLIVIHMLDTGPY